MKILWLTIVAVLSVVFAVSLTMQIPQVQTYVAGKVVSSLSDRLDGDISFEKIHFKPFTTLVLKNALILDRNPVRDPETGVQVDTFFKAQYIIAKFTLDGLFKHESLHLDKAFISNAQMNLVLEDKTDLGDGDTSTENLSRIFRLKKPETPKRSEKEIFHIGKVEIHNMGFSMKNHQQEKIPYHGGIDWNDLDVRNISINARELQFKAGIMSGVADKVTFSEKSGWVCRSISGSARVGRGKTIVENLHITDPWSDISLPLFMMSYRNSKEFSDFIDKVKLDGEIAPSSLDFRTLQYFAPQLGDNRLKTRVSGRMSGYVSGFEVSDISIATQDGGFSGKVNGSMTGLPEILETRIDARLSECILTARGLGDFISEWMPEGDLDLSRYAKGIMFGMNARARGLLNNLKIKAGITSILGQADADIRLDNILNSSKPFGISGKVATDDLDIGRIIGNDLIRQTTADVSFGAEMGRTLDFPSIDLDSLNVRRLSVYGYDYSDMTAEGHMDRESLAASVISNDPNLCLMAEGGYETDNENGEKRYHIDADIAKADLNRMNIDRRGKSEVKFRTCGGFTMSHGDEINGSLDITGIRLENGNGRYDIGDVFIKSHQEDGDHNMALTSPFAEGTFKGTASIRQFIDDFTGLTLKKEMPALFKDTTYIRSGNSYLLDFKFHNMMDLLAFALPGLYIEAGTSINAEIGREGEFKASLNSGRLAYMRQYLKDMSASFDNSDDELRGELRCSELQVSSVRLTDNSLEIFSKDNHIGAGLSYDNHSNLENRGEFIMKGDIFREGGKSGFDLGIMPSNLYINSKEWNILPSKVRILGKEISVSSFGLVSGNEAVTLDGRISGLQEDTLKLSLQRFDISPVNHIIPGIGISGALTGTAMLVSPLDRINLKAEMLCDSTFIADTPLGTVGADGEWDGSDRSISFSVKNEIDGHSSIDGAGKIFMNDRRIEAAVGLDRLSVGYVQPFLTDIFSEMKGYVSGDIRIDGNLDAPEISSTGGLLEDCLLKIAFTNVPYHADGAFHLDSRGVYFDDIRIKDRFDGTGSVAGSINWDHFRDISFDTSIRVNAIEGIDLTEDMSESFYGNIFGTGNLSINGPINSIRMSIDAVTAKRGQLHIPLTAGLTAGNSTNLLKFTEEEKETYIDPYEAMMTGIQEKEAKNSDFTVSLRVNASPDVEAFVEIDKASGNVLNGRGSGIIDLEIGSDVFNINGDYNITGGNYKFVAMGLVSRDFDIQEGSSIRFNGDIMESTLDIDAIYKTKASLSTLIADTTSVANRRTVECGISISDKISNPRLDFSIEIPDLDPTIKSRVESALSTEDKVQKQFLSLILSNSFLPDEQSGIVNNSSMLYSNVTEMLANQISNIFQKLDIPLDLGLNYQPSEKGNDIFDVAVSTQLFNNRVVVNGSVGNKQYSSGGTQDVVGDLDIEIKLDRSGSFRLNLFSHSADSYTNYLDNSQRNGVGLTYQTEFNSFGQFFRNMFSSKAKRQAARLAEEQAIIEGGKVEIEIQAPKDKTDERER